MPYGSARLRMFYGAGDYGRAMAAAQMHRGYYAAGGFFSSIGKAFGKVAGVVNKVPILGSLAKSIPIVGTALSIGSTIGDVLGGLGAKRIAAGGVEQGPSVASVKQLAAAGALGGKPGALPAFGTAALASKLAVERGSPRRRRRRTTRASAVRRRRPAGRRRRGDYGDDWSGGKPSRDKRGRYLTRAGGRRHHRRRHGRRRGRGGRVTFTTKTGRRVSFTARRGDGYED